MLSYAEIAVRQGILKVPKGAIISMRQAASLPTDQVLVMCTGGQGEQNAALQRMSEGEHKYVNLSSGDTVLVSSSPIPGNEIRYDSIGNKLAGLGVQLFRHPTHELDGCGPLHVSGHARRDELHEMIDLVRPKIFVPVHAGKLRRKYHAELAVESGIARKNVKLLSNGSQLVVRKDQEHSVTQMNNGSLLVDQDGNVVDGIVIKDRILLSQVGILTVHLTIDKRSGSLMTNPDIISRGFISLKDNEELLTQLRSELRRAVAQRFKRIDEDRFKTEIKDHVTNFIHDYTGLTPLVIPVINIISGEVDDKTVLSNKTVSQKERLIKDEIRFAEMRAKLLGSDQLD